MIRKFRAWNKETKTMVDLEKVTPLALDPNLNWPGIFLPFQDNLILEQWIGLKDKNGKDIFEGDICKAVQIDDYFPNDKLKEIITVITIEYVTEVSTRYGGGPDGSTEFKDIEVIGNIHENPELLEEMEKDQ